jgi:phosphopantothenoylcysteine decarboxylase/phosphopantothenate--cysteine ligase
MGFAIADTCYEYGAEVVLISGPTKEKCNYTGIKRIDIVSSDDMYEACKKFAPDMQVIIMSAAVADYKIENIAREKIKKQGHTMQLELTKTKDILHFLGTQKKDNQYLVGFALETNNERENAKIKLKNKNLDCIVLNSLNDEQAGFNFDTNKVTIIDKNENEFSIELKSKKEIAADIITYILNKINA